MKTSMERRIVLVVAVIIMLALCYCCCTDTPPAYGQSPLSPLETPAPRVLSWWPR